MLPLSTGMPALRSKYISMVHHFPATPTIHPAGKPLFCARCKRMPSIWSSRVATGQFCRFSPASRGICRLQNCHPKCDRNAPAVRQGMHAPIMPRIGNSRRTKRTAGGWRYRARASVSVRYSAGTQAASIILDRSARCCRQGLDRGECIGTAESVKHDFWKPRAIWQSYFAGVGVGVSVLARNGEILHAFQHRRLREGRGGSSSYRVSEQVDSRTLPCVPKNLRSRQPDWRLHVRVPVQSKYARVDIVGDKCAVLGIVAVTAGARSRLPTLSLRSPGAWNRTPASAIRLRNQNSNSL